jgi:peptidyl-tRNA hydrolase, PTH1 family
MQYIVALGNPGEKYTYTRHNVGWCMADVLRETYQFPEPVYSARYHSRISSGMIGDHEVMVLYPDTFMNHSGVVVKKILSLDPQAVLLVLHDETALPIGQQKISASRGDGGHNGVKSIIAETGHKDFTRIRIGIAPVSLFTGKMKLVHGEALARFVLQEFTRRERQVLETMKPLIVEAVRTVVVQGPAAAMNQYNVK